MKYVINKNFRIYVNIHDDGFILFPCVLLHSFLGIDITVGWGQFSVTLAYSSDDDNEVIDNIRKEIGHD